MAEINAFEINIKSQGTYVNYQCWKISEITLDSIDNSITSNKDLIDIVISFFHKKSWDRLFDLLMTRHRNKLTIYINAISYDFEFLNDICRLSQINKKVIFTYKPCLGMNDDRSFGVDPILISIRDNTNNLKSINLVFEIQQIKYCLEFVKSFTTNFKNKSMGLFMIMHPHEIQANREWMLKLKKLLQNMLLINPYLINVCFFQSSTSIHDKEQQLKETTDLTRRNVDNLIKKTANFLSLVSQYLQIN